MKILYYSPHPHIPMFAQTGAGTHIREMIQAFRQNGHEVETLIMGGEDASTGTHIQTANVSTGGIKKIIKSFIPSCIWEGIKDWQMERYDQYAQQRLAAKMDSYKPDLIYERAAYLQTSGIKEAKKKNIPHIFEWNGPFMHERKKLYGNSAYFPVAKKNERTQLSDTQLNVVTSTAMRDYFAKKYQLPENKFLVVPNAIDIAKIQTNSQIVAELREKWQLQDKIVIGFVGQIMAWHGVGILLSAFYHLHQAYPHLRLLIVGEGKMLAEYKQYAIEKGIAEKVIFTGKIPHKEVFNHIEVMDITVMANSNWYGSPVKIFEYGAMGKAIIAPDNIPVRDVMIDNEDGILVQPSTDSLKFALIKLIDNEELRKKVAVAFQQKVLQKYTWKHAAKHLLATHFNELFSSKI